MLLEESKSANPPGLKNNKELSLNKATPQFAIPVCFIPFKFTWKPPAKVLWVEINKNKPKILRYFTLPNNTKISTVTICFSLFVFLF